MSLASLASLALFSVVMAATPCPNNLLLATSGLTFGFTRTIPALAGVLAGVGLPLLLCDAGIGAAAVQSPAVHRALSIVGAAYMLFLVARLWRAAEAPDVTATAPMRAWEAAALQFLNPKAWMMAVTVASAYVPPSAAPMQTLGLVTAVFLVLATPCAALLAGFGAMLKTMLQHRRRLILVNRVMAAFTALSAGLVLYETWTAKEFA